MQDEHKGSDSKDLSVLSMPHFQHPNLGFGTKHKTCVDLTLWVKARQIQEGRGQTLLQSAWCQQSRKAWDIFHLVPRQKKKERWLDIWVWNMELLFEGSNSVSLTMSNLRRESLLGASSENHPVPYYPWKSGSHWKPPRAELKKPCLNTSNNHT